MSIFINKMIYCPFCRVRVSIYAKECSGCSADLSLISDMHLLPYTLFNRGLHLFQKGDFLGAMIKLSAAVELGKDFTEASMLLAQVAESMGLKELASQYRKPMSNNNDKTEIA